MKLGNYLSGLEITLEPSEHKHLTEDRCNVTIDQSDRKNWLLLIPDKAGTLKLSPTKSNGTRVLRFNSADTRSMKKFSAEKVASWMTSTGGIYGAKPTMSDVPVSRNVTAVKGKQPVIPFDQVNSAVKLINGFLRAYKTARVLVGEDRTLRIELTIEFGK
jgi:hypothetical protein